MKKWTLNFMLMSLVLLAGCAVGGQLDLNGQAQPATTGIGSEMVKLVRATSHIHRKYGMAQLQRNFEIRVKNAAYDKTVMVHHQLTNGQWTNLAARFVREAGDGFEIWEAGYSSMNTTLLTDRFVVFCTVNGQTWWDNNGGADFFLRHGDGVLLGSGIGVLANTFYFSSYSGNAVVNIDVKNIAYNKSVELVYTTDNWLSAGVVQAQYQYGYTYGYSYVTCPNQAGFERWVATVPVSDGNNFKYFLKYTVNGQEYFDNNYGRDYKLY